MTSLTIKDVDRTSALAFEHSRNLLHHSGLYTLYFYEISMYSPDKDDQNNCKT
jgi:hypothetical protein